VEEKKVGYIDAGGRLKIPYRFDLEFNYGWDFVQGLAPVREGRDWGYVDAGGQMVIPPQFDWAQPFSEGRALVRLGHGGPPYKIGYIDRTGRFVGAPTLNGAAQPFSEGLAAVESGKKWGFIDPSAKMVIESRFVWARSFSEGLARVIEDGECEVIEDPCECQDFRTSRFDPRRVLAPCQFSFIDKTGKKVMTGFHNAGKFAEGLAPVRTMTTWGFINHQGALVIAAQFQRAKPFSDGLAAVMIEQKWGFIDKTGKILIQPDFDNVEDFSEGIAVVWKNQQYTYIDNTGKQLFGRSFSLATPFVQGLAHVVLGNPFSGEMGYINREGTVIYKYEAHER
jgi:hypothetical protein